MIATQEEVKVRFWIVLYRHKVNGWRQSHQTWDTRDEARWYADTLGGAFNEVKIKSVWLTV